MKKTISIEILKISVSGKNSGYYTIDYKYKIDDDPWYTSAYSSSWSSQSSSGFRNKLKRSYAFEVAFEQVTQYH